MRTVPARRRQSWHEGDDSAVAAFRAPGSALPGEVAFDLYETYGFPLEVTEEVGSAIEYGAEGCSP